MKLFISRDDIRYLEAFQGLPHRFEQIELFTLQDHLTAYQGHCILVSDVSINFLELDSIIQTALESKIFFVLTTASDAQELKRIVAIAKSKGITIIGQNQTSEQILDQLQTICFARQTESSRVIACIGAKPQVGVTSSLLNIGYILTQKSECKVGILGLNPYNPGTSFLEYSGKTLNEIWGGVHSGQLTGESLLQKMQEIKPNVYYLAGNTDLLKIFYYGKEGANYLIELARELFDVVLLDCGAYADNALSAQGLYSADHILLQMNQGKDARDSWTRISEQLFDGALRIDSNKIMLIFNKMYKNIDVESDTQLAKHLGHHSVGSLPYVNRFYLTEILNDVFAIDDPLYKKEISKVVDFLVHFYNLRIKEESQYGLSSNKRRNWFQRAMVKNA